MMDNEGIITISAKAFAKRHNIADVGRVISIMKKMAVDSNRLQLEKGINLRNPLEDGLAFYPSLDEALDFLPPDKALLLFETAKIDDLASRVSYFAFLTARGTPFYEHKELAGLIRQFIGYLKENKSSLLAIGYPAKSFEKSHWLYENLSRLYPVKIPYRVHKESRFQQRFHGPEILTEKDDEGNLVFDYAWSKEPLPLFAPHDSNRLTTCSYSEAYLIHGLTDQDVEHIEDYRARIFNLKIDILELANDYLCQKKNKDGFWNDCIDKISQRLTKDVIEQFIKIENAYPGPFVSFVSSKFMITCPSSNPGVQPNLETGGIDNIFGFIFFIETELNIGQMHNIRSELLNLTDAQIPESYYQLLLSPAIADIDKAIERSLCDSVKTSEFEEFFNNRIRVDSEQKLRIRLEVASKSYDTVRAFSELVETGQVNLSFSPSQSISTPSNKKITPITLPPGTRWADITIEFVDRHNTNIKCKGKTYHRDYKEMGFEDSKTRKPNKQWELLYSLAEQNGEIFWEKSPPAGKVNFRKIEHDFGPESYEDNPRYRNKGFSIIKAPDKTKKMKQLLSQTLRAFFPIEGDPFFPYNEVKAYKIRISLIP